jgi:adenylate cyclase
VFGLSKEQKERGVVNGSEILIEERVILFTDVHNYSMVYDAPLENYGFLQEMYDRLGDLIVGCGGEILKYLGDAMLCVFPAGYEVEAVGCGRKMRKAFSDMAEQRGLGRQTELEVGIGSGQVVFAECGHATLRRKDIFGEEVNRTAVIGHYRGVAITERVYDRVRESHETRRLPDLEVKWRREPLKVWAVVE